MTAPTGIRAGVGFRSCTLFALTAAGLPAATSSSTPYEGVKLSGAKVLTINDPEPRKIYTPGDDSIVVADLLPPQEGISGELHAGKLNDVVDALLSGQKAFSVGDTAVYGEGTDKRGFETLVGLLAYQHAPDADLDAGTSGLGGWSGILMPKAYLFQRETGFNDQPMDRVYTVMPMIVSKHLWGVAFAANTEGFLKTQLLRTYGRGRPKLIAWQGDGVTDDFSFPVASLPIATSTVKVWVDGVAATPTVALDKITFVAAPADKAIITVLYEF